MDIDSLQQSTSLNKALPLAVGLAAFICCFLTASHYWDGVLFSLYIEKVAEGALPRAISSIPTICCIRRWVRGFSRARTFQVSRCARVRVLQLINVLMERFVLGPDIPALQALFPAAELGRSPRICLPWRDLVKFSTDADTLSISVAVLRGWRRNRIHYASAILTGVPGFLSGPGGRTLFMSSRSSHTSDIVAADLASNRSPIK